MAENKWATGVISPLSAELWAPCNWLFGGPTFQGNDQFQSSKFGSFFFMETSQVPWEQNKKKKHTLQGSKHCDLAILRVCAVPLKRGPVSEWKRDPK